MVLPPDVDPSRSAGDSPLVNLPDEAGAMPRCAGCGYNLTGLTEDRCPECGRAFDPEDPQSFAPPPTSAVGLLVFNLSCLGLMVLPPLVWARIVSSPGPFCTGAAFEIIRVITAVVWSTAIALWGWSVVRSVRTACMPAYLVRGRWAAWAVVAEAVGTVGLIIWAVL